MKSETLIRLIVCALLTVLLVWVGVRYLGVSLDARETAGALVGLVWSMFIGFVWLMILGWPIIQSVAGKFGSFYMASDESFRVRPEYSIAEARVKQGLYKEAIEAFRADIAKFPEEATPHVRIAELQLERFDDAAAAIAELKVALPKCKNLDSFSLVTNRLADLYVHHAQNRSAAVDYLQEIARHYPDTKQARSSIEKIQRLTDVKIADTATDA